MSIIVLIGHILTYCSLFWTILFFVNSKKREFVTFEIKTGELCFRCKSKTEIVKNWSVFDRDLNNKTLCKACKRDDALNSVFSKRNFLKDFDITDDKWQKIFLPLNLVAIAFNAANIFIPGLNLIGGLFLFTAQFCFYYRFMQMTRKKTQSN